MDSLNPTSLSASASSESAQEMGGDGTLSNSSDRSAETARVTGGTDEGDTTMMSSKIRFTLSASSQNAASSSVVVIKKKKHIPETFRDQEDGDDAELAKKRRVEALLLQPMEDDSEDTSAHGNTTAGAATTLAVSDDTVHTHSTTSDDCTTLADMDAQKTNDTPIIMEQQDKSSLLLTQEHDKINQQTGWRVKLYRLNTDGSWDDCGTGRILCISSAKQILQDSSEQHAAGNSSSSSDHSGISSNAEAWKAFDRIPHTAVLTLQQQQRLAVALDEAIHRDLGNPILFMHAEITNMNSAAAVDATHLQYAPRVLLRARVLLWETYQRQGDSIITWCEPAPAETNANTNTNNTTSQQQQQQESPPSHNNNQSHPAHTSSQDESCSYQGVSTNHDTHIYTVAEKKNIYRILQIFVYIGGLSFILSR